jgi:CheY-like chemotaxis protein
LSNLTVLVVEDERTVRMAVRYYLEGFGARILEASSGPEALRCCERYKGKLDLLLTDVVLPGMNGVELADRVEAIRPDIEFVFMSAHETEWLAAQGRIERAVEVLHKPFSPGELLARIEILFGGAVTAAERMSDASREPDVADGLKQPAHDEAPASTPTGTILVVEDDRGSRLALSDFFEASGWKVLSAASAEEARRCYQDFGEKLSLLLTDYELAAEKGDALARDLRALQPGMPVVYMSGYDDLNVEVDGPVIVKPLELEQLLEVALRASDSA